MFEIGQTVKVPCSVSPGPFSDERLVTVQTIEGTISGFVRSDDLIQTDEENGYLIGVVTALDPDAIKIKLRGSFFTTNGLAAIARNLPVAA